MKLLLTSNGICNESLKKALYDLTQTTQISTIFITNASNNLNIDKSWLVDDIYRFKELGRIDLLDLISTPKELWEEKFNNCNVIAFGGGDVAVMKEIIESGFNKQLKELLKSKVYVGISAGSIIMSQSVWGSSEYLYTHSPDDVPRGLGYTTFNFRPHLNSPDFPQSRKEILEKIAQKYPKERIYACDDETGIKIEGSSFEIISEGEYIEFN